MDPSGTPALCCRWDFGDGGVREGSTVAHSYTHRGDFRVQLTVDGLDDIPFKQNTTIRVSGNIQPASPQNRIVANKSIRRYDPSDAGRGRDGSDVDETSRKKLLA